MTVTVNAGSVVAKAGQQVNLGSLYTTQGASNPAYLILTGLDRAEYTVTNNGQKGSLSGNGNSLGFSSIGGDAYSLGVVFTYQAATGRYYSSAFGYLDKLTYTASANQYQNANLALYGTNNLSLANSYANNPYVLSANPTCFTSVGNIDIVTRNDLTSGVQTQATVSSVCAAAQSFVGKAWNDNGCWVLASNISAQAGASLPLTATSIGVSGAANGEWIVVYDGRKQSGNWQSIVSAGDMITFGNVSGGGHITTCVSGSGATAMLIDNITYVGANGKIQNAANDGSAADIIIAAPHAASGEWAQAVGSSVEIYRLDTPTITVKTPSLNVLSRSSTALSPLFTTTDAGGLGTRAITQYQFYDAGTGSAASDLFLLGGTTTAAHSAAAALTVGAASLSSLSLVAGTGAGVDTISVRAYNGAYWGDWTSFSLTIGAAAGIAPTLANQTADQTWTAARTASFTLAANTFIDPDGQALTYKATLANGTALPTWLSFNGATKTFSGLVPVGASSIGVKVTATDTSGLSASETFSIIVPALKAPTLTVQTPLQTWYQGTAVSFGLAGTFTDPQGLPLTYAATLTNGGALPSWLKFNAATGGFSGTVASGISGLGIKVTATDSGGLSTSETFQVNTPSAAPVLAFQTANQTWNEKATVTFSLSSNTFTDPVGRALTYTATQSNGAALPSWLKFNASTLTFSGTVPTGAADVSVTLTAKDTVGLSASETFTITTPAAPTLVTQTSAQTWNAGSAVSFSLPANTFIDPQGLALTYSASQAANGGPSVTSWLHFNAKTGTFSGTAPTTASGTIALAVTATNTNGQTSTETFSVNFKSVSGLTKTTVTPVSTPSNNNGYGLLASA